MIRSAQNIQAAYAKRGYEQVQVRSELARRKGTASGVETVLRFIVTEGLPTRIASVHVVTDSGSKTDTRPDLAKFAGPLAGDPYDQEKISLAKRAVLDALASEDFIGARVTDVMATAAAAPVTPPAAVPSAAKWVSLELRVDLGDRVSFGFRGNTVFSRAQLLRQIEELRLIGFGKDYVGVIRDRIRDEYRAMGYARVDVTPYTFERQGERHVTYAIEEGPRVVIQSVDFDGNRLFPLERLRNEFYARASRVTQLGFFVDRDAERAAELVVEWMKSQGYLSSKLVTVNRTYSPNGSRIRLVIYLYEGNRTLVRSVKFEGMTVCTPDEARRIVSVHEGEALNLFAFNEGLQALKTAYRAKGYLDAKILNEGGEDVVRYFDENTSAAVQLRLDEGPQFRVSRIDIEGLQMTRQHVVRRELSLRDGDVIEEEKVTESEARLRKLGAFSSATIRLADDPQKPGTKIVRVVVEESLPGVYGGGIGYRNDLGVRLFGQAAYTNVGGRNHTISLNGSVNKRFDQSFCANQTYGGSTTQGDACFLEGQVQLGYVWPWFVFGDTTFRPSITGERRQFIRFDATTFSAEASLDRPLLRKVNLRGGLTYSLEWTKQFNALFPVDNNTLRIGSFKPSLTLDLRDNSLSPTSGFFSTSSFEYASTSFGSQSDPPVGYTRFLFRADGYVPLIRDITWFLSFRTGFARNLVKPEDGSRNPAYALPLSKQFVVGGHGSLRGYGEQELNVQDQAITGTLSYVNYRTQIDFPFAGALRLGPFLDAANLLVDRYSFGMLRYGAGIGVRYRSPVGPVNFDWGFKLDPKPGEDPYRFYFSIGLI